MAPDVTVETEESSAESRKIRHAPTPGVLLVYSVARPTLLAAAAAGPISIGRSSFGGALEDDDRISREHARIRITPEGVVVEDAGSRNGTHVDGVRITTSVIAKHGSVIRLGRSVLLVVGDVRAFEEPAPVVSGEAVVGPTLRAAHARVTRAASSGEAVLLVGESGSGKELAARVFHEATGREGALVAVNCAAIPAGVAERLLFGTRKGAYSGADTDADGYVQSAHQGTLFLDELAELDLLVQAKLLRVIESQEVYALGASRAKKVDVRVCCATHRDLRAAVATGTFREDLYFRICRPEVRIPPLRERKEEIPWLIAREIARTADDLSAHPLLIEECLLRNWPGNVRELLAETRRAASEALSQGQRVVEASDLSAIAGSVLATPPPSSGYPSIPPPPRTPMVLRNKAKAWPEEATILRALEDHGGNVTRAARALGLHRTQLRRWIEKRGS